MPDLAQAPSPVSWPKVILDPVVEYLPRIEEVAVVHGVCAAFGEVQDPRALELGGLLIVVVYLPGSVPPASATGDDASAATTEVG